MSIINKMLQDLDRRQGMSDPDAAPTVAQVRTVPAARKEREWFWRIIAVLMIAAVGWVGWIAWQLQPRPSVATAQAFKAAESVQRKTAAAAPPPAAVPAETKRAENPAAQGTVTGAAKPPATPAAPPAAPETLKLAQDMSTPVRDEARKPAAKEEPRAPALGNAAAPRPQEVGKTQTGVAAATKPAPEVGAGATKPAPIAQPTPKVEKRERVRSPQERAEAEFRRGVALLNQGRISEAEDELGAALRGYPGHEPARQALVALDLEQGRMDSARRLLQEGLALNPANVRFAAVLARILIERKDYQGALDAANGALEHGQGDAELQAMRGTALQRLGRHAEASEAFRASLRAAPQNGSGWMALAISLEAQGMRPESADAYRRAAAAGTLGADARTYAEQRARALQ